MPKNGVEHKPKIRSVKFNVLMNMILTSSAFIFPLITVPYVSRVLEPSGTGIVAWAQTFVSYFSLIALLGMNVYGVRECARVRDDRAKLSQLVQELSTILLISTSVVYVVFLVSIFLIPRTREDISLMLIFSVSIWLASCGMEWFYQAIEQYGYITVRNIALKFVALILMFAFVRSSEDYRIYGITIVISGYGANIFNILRLRKFVDFSLHRKLNLRRHLKPMMSFTVSSISSGMYIQIDMLLIGFMCSNVVIGLYQLVIKIKTLCITAVNSVGSVMLPRLSYYESKGGHEQTTRLIGKNINFLFVVSMALIAVLIVGAEPIIMLLGGKDYVGATTALRLIAPTMLFAATNSILSQYMVARGKEKIYAAINFFGLICAIMLDAILIRSFSLNGAAIGVCLCELITLIVRLFVLHGFVREVRRHTDIVRILLAASIAFGASCVIPFFVYGLNSFIMLLSEACVFGFVYLMLLILLKENLICSILKIIHS